VYGFSAFSVRVMNSLERLATEECPFYDKLSGMLHTH